jgi:hypothetical protein
VTPFWIGPDGFPRWRRHMAVDSSAARFGKRRWSFQRSDPLWRQLLRCVWCAGRATSGSGCTRCFGGGSIRAGSCSRSPRRRFFCLPPAQWVAYCPMGLRLLMRIPIRNIFERAPDGGAHLPIVGEAGSESCATAGAPQKQPTIQEPVGLCPPRLRQGSDAARQDSVATP